MPDTHWFHEQYTAFLKKEIYEVYLLHFFHSFAFSLFGIFLPIYLLTLGFSLQAVFLYFAVRYGLSALFFIGAASIAKKIGVKHTLLIWFPFAILTLWYYFQLPELPHYLLFIAVLDSFQAALYWMPLHHLFAHAAPKKEMGTDLSKLFSLRKIANLLGPLLGGIIITRFGFTALFIVAAVLFTLGVIGLFFSKGEKKTTNFTIHSFARVAKTHKHFFKGIDLLFFSSIFELIIWPIFAYLLLKNTVSLGIIGSLFSLGGIFFALIIGKKIDQEGKERYLHYGALFLLGVWVLRSIISIPLALYLLTLLAGFFRILIFVPYDTLFYQLAKSMLVDEFIILREIHINIGRTVALFLAMIFINNIQLSFLFVPLALFIFMRNF